MSGRPRSPSPIQGLVPVPNRPPYRHPICFVSPSDVCFSKPGTADQHLMSSLIPRPTAPPSSFFEQQPISSPSFFLLLSRLSPFPPSCVCVFLCTHAQEPPVLVSSFSHFWWKTVFFLLLLPPLLIVNFQCSYGPFRVLRGFLCRFRLLIHNGIQLPHPLLLRRFFSVSRTVPPFARKTPLIHQIFETTSPRSGSSKAPLLTLPDSN